MSDDKEIDLSAVSRVARHIDLRDIRLIGLSAQCLPAPFGQLIPRLDHECSVQMTNENLLVVCRYTFNVESSGSAVSEAEIVYLLTYDRDGTPLAEEDVTQFAAANGVYHSWPFLRQLLYDLTSKMGFPPLTLPVFLVSPKATQQNKDVEESKEDNVPKTRLPAKRAKRKRS